MKYREEKKGNILCLFFKRPWEMTLLEYGKSLLAPHLADQITEAKEVCCFSRKHLKEIKSAIARYDRVPLEVLGEYYGIDWVDDAIGRLCENRAMPESLESKLHSLHTSTRQNTESLKGFLDADFLHHIISGALEAFIKNIIEGFAPVKDVVLWTPERLEELVDSKLELVNKSLSEINRKDK